MVSREETSAMAKFIAAMNQGNDDAPAADFVDIDENMSMEDRRIIESMGGTRSIGAPPKPRPPQPKEINPINDMKRILLLANGNGPTASQEALKIVHGMSVATTNVINDSRMERELREALETEMTPTGARIGKWEIQKMEVSGRKFFNISAVGARNLVVAELTLYEAAQGIVRILNEGGGLHSREAIDLLSAENEYAKALEDAIRYRTRIASKPNDPRAKIFESRYSEARHRAIVAKDRVIKLTE